MNLICDAVLLIKNNFVTIERKIWMTTYSYNITLNDSECMAMEDALKLLIDFSQERIAEGEGAPHHARVSDAKEILERLNQNVTQTSGNNFWS